VLGYCASALCLRADLAGDPSFDELTRRLRDEVLQAADMALPLGQVVRALGRPP